MTDAVRAAVAPRSPPAGSGDVRPTYLRALRPTAVSEHFVYVIECADGSFYTGYTTDVERRVAEHDAGEGAKYTRGRTPVELVHVEAYATRSAAMGREYELKQLSRSEKERLVEGE